MKRDFGGNIRYIPADATLRYEGGELRNRADQRDLAYEKAARRSEETKKREETMQEIAKTLLRTFRRSSASDEIRQFVALWKKVKFNREPVSALIPVDNTMKEFPTLVHPWQKTLRDICHNHKLKLTTFGMEE